MELNVWTCEIHHSMLQLTANLNSLAVDQCTPTNMSPVFYHVSYSNEFLAICNTVFQLIKRAQFATFQPQCQETHAYWNCCNCIAVLFWITVDGSLASFHSSWNSLLKYNLVWKEKPLFVEEGLRKVWFLGYSRECHGRDLTLLNN